MHLRSRTAPIVASLVLLLCAGGVGIAAASPDGDDDSGYNATGTNGAGTAFVPAGDRCFLGRPLVDEAPDGSSVSATLIDSMCFSSSTENFLRLTRISKDGQKLPVTTPSVYASEIGPPQIFYTGLDLLDLKVFDDGSFRVLIRATLGVGSQSLLSAVFSPEGEFQRASSTALQAPAACANEGTAQSAESTVDAARTAPDGSVSALWNCRPSAAGTDVWIAHYAKGASSEDAATQVDAPGVEGNPDAGYGEDLEFGPSGDPYVLVSSPAASSATVSTSVVYRFEAGTLDRVVPTHGSARVPGLPVDLAIDLQGRPVVWTRPLEPDVKAGSNAWQISRLNDDLLSLDPTWGSGGTATIEDPDLPAPHGSVNGKKFDYLTVRGGNRVLALGGVRRGVASVSARGAGDDVGAVIAGLTAGGAVDTGFGDSGFKVISFPPPQAGSGEPAAFFAAVGEPQLQSDQKILVPHTSVRRAADLSRAVSQRIAPPPSNDPLGGFQGVTRLLNVGQPDAPGAGTPATGSAPSGLPARPVRPSSIPASCGRRAISLVRADVRGRKIRLSGLVGAKLYGKKVTIETNPTAVKASAYSRTTTVTASKRTGAFSATVRAPKRSQLGTVRYRAKSGRATSPVLKLPQSLTSRSVKSAKGTITVRGQVKRSVLGKRNTVKIRRLVCGRYRTVAVVRPDARGRYTATFKTSALGGISFYRAESVVQVRPGSKKYAIQYARAIAVRTTTQTG